MTNTSKSTLKTDKSRITKNQEVALNYFSTRTEKDFNSLYKQFKPLVYSICNRILKDKEHTNECVNKVFVLIWKNIDKYDPTRKFSSWIGKISYNAALGHLADLNYVVKGNSKKIPTKKTSYENSIEFGSHVLKNKIKEVSIQESNISKKQEIEDFVNSLLVCLSEKNRELFIKRELDYVPDKELAQEYNIAESTLRVKMLQFKNKIKNYVKQNSIECISI